jgi:hypothetical protein
MQGFAASSRLLWASPSALEANAMAEDQSGPSVNLPTLQILQFPVERQHFGELIEHRDLTRGEAEAITTRIKSAIGDLMGEVAKGHLGRVWIALGYESWADYMKGEFDRPPLHLQREQRQAVTMFLHRQGMSTRAIAAATGTGNKTVARDG